MIIKRPFLSYKNLEGQKLPLDFFLDDDVVTIAKSLLGKVLVSRVDNRHRAGVITEVEAYRAPEDKASHAYQNKKTKRTEVMFYEGGHAYIYLCYGIHHMFNIVTGPESVAHAVLIRSFEPLQGEEYMIEARNKKGLDYRLTSGPGCAGQALGAKAHMSGASLLRDLFWLEDRGIQITLSDIVATPRIGIDYAEEWADRPWRFVIKDHPWVSRR